MLIKNINTQRHLLFLLLFLSLKGYTQDEYSIVESTLDKEQIKSHMFFLASDELEGRDTPSRGLKKAARYIINELKEYGVESLSDRGEYTQQVMLRKTVPPSKLSLNIGEDMIEEKGTIHLLSGPNGSFKGKILFLKFREEDSLENIDLTRKIVFIQAGDGRNQNWRQILRLSGKRSEWAAKRGAAALIEIYPGMPDWLSGNFYRAGMDLEPEAGMGDNKIPHIILNVTMEYIRPLIESSFPAELNIRGKIEETIESENIFGYVEGTDPDKKKEFIVCTAHYDHIGIGKPDASGDSIYNGARDNATGVTSLLIAAKNLTQNPVKRPVLFVFFTAEEKGLLGSRWFMQYPPVDPTDMAFCLNNDNGSYTDTSIVSIPGLSRTNTGNRIREACEAFGLEATDDFPEASILYSASDNIIFSRTGIPSVTYSLGFRSMDTEVRRLYHQPSDEPESIDYHYLYRFCGGYTLSLRLIGNMEQRPYWLKGDIFYEKGEDLYGK